MRFEGKLTKWNEEQSFGFITPDFAGPDVFVHLSAFERDGRRPQLQEPLIFNIAQDSGGKRRAVGVCRPSSSPLAPSALAPRQAPPPRTESAQRSARDALAPSEAEVARNRRQRVAAPQRSVFQRLVLVLVACSVVAAAYWQYTQRQHKVRVTSVEAQAESMLQDFQPAMATPVPPVLFRCDGRQHCSQMTSCSEAKFFHANCPGTRMDGDSDGTPCEQQWCTSPFAP